MRKLRNYIVVGCFLVGIMYAVIFPMPTSAREYTQAERELIAYISRRIQEIIVQINALIAQRQRGTATTPPDRTAPLITVTTSTSTGKSFVVEWTTNKPAKSKFAYGLGPNLLPVGTTTRFITDDRFLLQHSVTVTGPTAHTTYYYTIEATDALGNSAKTNFAELLVPNPQVFTTPTIRDIIARPATTSAQIAWGTDTETTSRVYFTTLYPFVLTAPTTSYTSSSSLVKIHTMLLTELIASSTYYYAVESVDAYGFKTTSGDFRFITLKQ